MNRETVSCRRLGERVHALVRLKAKMLGVTVALEVEDRTVCGDVKLLEEALLNLVENALRYSGSEKVVLRIASEGPRVVFSVTDCGIGIAAEHLPRLFERFYRVDKARSRSLGGTGLGLAIVKHIVQLHRGEVFVSSRPGDRTVFGFRL